MKHVIIGNSAAAISAINAIRSRDASSSITLVTAEDVEAYSPVLTTYYIAGRLEKRSAYLTNIDFYRNASVSVKPNTTVSAIDPTKSRVITDAGEHVDYDQLLIATGASPAGLDCVDPDAEEFVSALRTLEDAEKIRNLAENAREVVCVGAGLVSLQTGNATYREGTPLTFLVGSRQILSQNVDAEGAAMLVRCFSASRDGLNFRFGADIRQIGRRGGRAVVALASGEEIEADLVVVGKGVAPNMAFTAGSGIVTHRGIVADQNLRTNIENIYVAGDVCESTDLVSGKMKVTANWLNACEQGRIAGLNMCGCNDSFSGSVAENVTSVFGSIIASVGDVGSVDAAEKVFIRKDERKNIYRKIITRKDGHLKGALFINDVADIGVVKSAIIRGDTIGRMADDLKSEYASVAKLIF